MFGVFGTLVEAIELIIADFRVAALTAVVVVVVDAVILLAEWSHIDSQTSSI